MPSPKDSAEETARRLRLFQTLVTMLQSFRYPGSPPELQVKFSGDPPAWRLERTDPIWTQWLNQGASYLMIITSLPGNNFAEGAFDRRRLIVPLDKNAWDANKKTLGAEDLQ